MANTDKDILERDILALLAKRCGEEDFLFTVRDLRTFGARFNTEAHYRKALKAMVKSGQILRKKNPKFVPDTWCLASRADELDALLTKEASDHQLDPKTQIINLLDRYDIECKKAVVYGHDRLTVAEKDWTGLLNLLRRIP